MPMQSPVPGMWILGGKWELFLSQEAARGAAPQIWQKILLSSVQIGEGEGGDFNFHT